MKMNYLRKYICALLLLLFFIPASGNADGYMFRCAIRDKAGNLWFGTIGEGAYREFFSIAANKNSLLY